MTRYSIRQGWAAVVTAFLMSATMVGMAAASLATYSYQKTGSAPGDLPISIEMAFDHRSGPISGTTFAGGFDGLQSFAFRMGSVLVDLDDLREFQSHCAGGSPACFSQQLAYSLTPEEGSFRFNNSQFDFAFDYGGGWLEGNFNTDFPGPAACRTSGRCNYEGLWLAIPEPGAVAMLAAGVLGLVWRRGRRKGRPALAS